MADAQAKIRVTASDETAAGFASVRRNVDSLTSTVMAARTAALGIFGAGFIAQAGDGARAIVTARVEAEKLSNLLAQGVGAANVGREFTFLQAEAARLGLSFNDAALQYAKFASAARGTAIEGQGAREVFIGLAQAGTVLGMSSEEMSGAFNALQQMISKGKVSAEELRGQLGERLPGAFQIAARAMGVTTAELDKMLQSGEVMAGDFLPRFARQLQQEFAGGVDRAAQSTQASLNRIETAWQTFKRTLAEGPVGDAAATALSNLSTNLTRAAERFRLANSEARGFLDTLADFSRQIPIGITGFALAGESARREWTARRREEGDRRSSGRAAILQREAEIEREERRGPDYDREARRMTAAQQQAALNLRLEEDRKAWSTYATRFRSQKQQQAQEEREIRALAERLGEDPAAMLAELRSRGEGAGEARRRAAEAKRRAEQEAEERRRVQLDAVGFAPSFNEDVARLKSVFDSGAISAENYRAAYVRLIESQTEGGRIMAAQREERERAIELEAETLRKAAEREREALQTQRESVDAIRQRADQLRDENETAGLGAAAVERLSIARREEYLALLRVSGVGLEQIKVVELEIEARKKLADEMQRGDEIRRNADRIKETVEETRRAAEQMQESITDALMRGFESGRGFAENFKRTLMATINTLVLRPSIEFLLWGKSGATGSGIGSADLLRSILGRAAGNLGSALFGGTAPINTGGWISPEGSMTTPTGGGLFGSIGSALSGAMGASAKAAPSVSITLNQKIDARTDEASIRQATAMAVKQAEARIYQSLRGGGRFQREVAA